MASTWTVVVNHVSDSGHLARVRHEVLALTVVDVVVRDVCWSMMVLDVCRESRVVRLRMFVSIHELVYKRQRPTVASDLWENGYAAGMPPPYLRQAKSRLSSSLDLTTYT